MKKEKYEDRLVFMRKYWFFDSVKEIAERYNMTENKVKGILFRSRKRLRKYLMDEGWRI